MSGWRAPSSTASRSLRVLGEGAWATTSSCLVALMSCMMRIFAPVGKSECPAGRIRLVRSRDNSDNHHDRYRTRFPPLIGSAAARNRPSAAGAWPQRAGAGGVRTGAGHRNSAGRLGADCHRRAAGLGTDCVLRSPAGHAHEPCADERHRCRRSPPLPHGYAVRRRNGAGAVASLAALSAGSGGAGLMRRYEARALGRGSGSPGRASWLRLALLGAIAIGLALAACQHQPSAAPGGLYAPCDVDSQLPLLGYEVVATLPHDPAAYTQGLLLHEGVLYESTGLYGRSSLRRLERASGRELARVELPARLFGEGLALVQDRLYQLSWREGEVRFYSLEDLRLLTTLRIAGEGWGLEYDGHSLIQTDGSAELIFRHPDDLAELRRLPV